MGLALCLQCPYMAAQRLPQHLTVTVLEKKISIWGHTITHSSKHSWFLVSKKKELPTSPALVLTWDFIIVLGIGGFP